MLGGNELALFSRGRKESGSGKHVRSAQQSTGTLMDGGDGLLGEQLRTAAGDSEVVSEVCGHLDSVQRFEASSAEDARCEWPRGVIQQLVHEVVLAAENDGQQRLGIEVHLGVGVHFG